MKGLILIFILFFLTACDRGTLWQNETACMNHLINGKTSADSLVGGTVFAFGHSWYEIGVTYSGDVVARPFNTCEDYYSVEVKK
jgi:hypothetical protein